MKLKKIFLLIVCLTPCTSIDAPRRQRNEQKGLAGILEDNERVISGLHFTAEQISCVPIDNNESVKIFQYPTQIIDTADSGEPIDEKIRKSRLEIFSLLSRKVGHGQQNFIYRSAVEDQENIRRYEATIEKTARDLKRSKEAKTPYIAFVQITNGNILPQEVIMIYQEADSHRHYIALLIRKKNQRDKDITRPGSLYAQFVVSIEEALNTAQEEEKFKDATCSQQESPSRTTSDSTLSYRTTETDYSSINSQ